jgi:nucleotide-binding universal stress UspA family protein
MTDQAPVLVAYDGSELAKAGIREAGRLLRKGQAAIVLTVWEDMDSYPGVAPITPPYEMQRPVNAERTAHEGARLAEQYGFHATPVVAKGAPTWDRIIAAAEEAHADVIVLGSHGRSGIGYALLGSVATAVAHHAQSAVLIVNGTDDQSGNGSAPSAVRAADRNGQ